MKIALALLAALVIVPASAAAAQQQVRPAVRPVMRPPATVTPHGRAARSTSQAALTHSHQPLTALPAFTATSLNGKPVAAESLARPEHWLLIYTRDGCEPCQKLLITLGKSESASLRRGAPYVIVVAHSGTYGALDAMRAKYPALADATWLEDTTSSVVGALKPAGTPVLYAMHGKQVAWIVPGGLDNRATVEKLSRSWMESADPAAAGQQSASVTSAGAASK